MTSVLSPEAYFHPSLPEFWFGFVFAVFGLYVVLDGFDFGIGILYADVDDVNRETMLAAFGPVWKANEVWLILFGTTLFAAFPAVYSNLLSRHYLLIFALLLALVMRGVGSKVRKERSDELWVETCDRLFVAGSVAAPFLLGMLVAGWLFGLPSVLDIAAVAVGLSLTALCVVFGAAFMAIKSRGRLQTKMYRRGTQSTVAYVGLIATSLVYALVVAPGAAPPPTVEAVAGAALLTVGCAGVGLAAIRARRPYSWFGSVVGMGLVLVGFVAYTMFPVVDPAVELSIREGIVAPLALNLNTIFAVTFIPIIFGYFGLLYSVFSGPVEEGVTYG